VQDIAEPEELHDTEPPSLPITEKEYGVEDIVVVEGTVVVPGIVVVPPDPPPLLP
jgi:hypothetical protein